MTKQEAIDNLAKHVVSTCQKCKTIGDRSHNPTPVIGFGDPESPIMVIGEAPGFVEDCINRPMASMDDLKQSSCISCSIFSDCMKWFLTGNKSPHGHITCSMRRNINGAIVIDDQQTIENNKSHSKINTAGQQVENIMNSFGLKKADVFITNAVLCRPFDNRQPFPDEIKNCNEYIIRLIDIIRPRYIVAMGKIASSLFVDNITAMRPIVGTKHTKSLGEYIDERSGDDYEFTVIPVWHASYLLRKMKDDPTEARNIMWDIYDVFKYVLYDTDMIDSSKIKYRPPVVRMLDTFNQDIANAGKRHIDEGTYRNVSTNFACVLDPISNTNMKAWMTALLCLIPHGVFASDYKTMYTENSRDDWFLGVQEYVKMAASFANTMLHNMPQHIRDTIVHKNASDSMVISAIVYGALEANIENIKELSDEALSIINVNDKLIDAITVPTSSFRTNEQINTFLNLIERIVNKRILWEGPECSLDRSDL